MVILTHSSVAHNHAHVSGLLNSAGVVIITSSTFAGNSGDGAAGLQNLEGGVVFITKSTFAHNTDTTTGGLRNAGIMFLTNSTVARNRITGALGPGIGGLENLSPGTVVLHNTILALNTAPDFSGDGDDGPSDCSGVVTSLGTNLFGTLTGCTLTRPPDVRDLTGDPSLDDFTDPGRPGHGHFPLLPDSPAIDAGHDAVCPRRDQLGQRRVHIPRVGTSRCDIGAMEFQRRDDHQPDAEDDEPDAAPGAAQASQ